MWNKPYSTVRVSWPMYILGYQNHMKAGAKGCTLLSYVQVHKLYVPQCCSYQGAGGTVIPRPSQLPPVEHVRKTNTEH